MATTLTNALDTLSVRTYGANGHAQESWSNHDITSMMVELFFQLVRVPKTGYARKVQLATRYKQMINVSIQQENVQNINYLMALLFQTRDLAGGKGEYSLFYHLLPCWEDHWQNALVKSKIEAGLSLVFTNVTYETCERDVSFKNPYGSWKDVKYIYQTYRDIYNWQTSDIAHNCWNNYNALRYINKLVVDELLVKRATGSLVFKWMPREKSSKFGWQAKIFARLLWDNYNNSKIANPGHAYVMKVYRQLLAAQNKKLKTTQIYQCNGKWSDIDFAKNVTSITMQKQRSAFLCVGTNKSAVQNEDRQICSNNFRNYLAACAQGTQKIKAARAQGEALIKDLWCNSGVLSEEEKQYANAVWTEHIASITPTLSKAIVMLDLSASMTWDNCPFYAAIWVALTIACAPGGTKRIMIFSRDAQWINLEDGETLTDMLAILKSHAHLTGMSTDIYKAFQAVGNACLYKDMTPEEVGDTVVVILSDMAIDTADPNFTSVTHGQKTLQENVQDFFREKGAQSSHKRPYPTPTLAYWNMKSTDGFPTNTSSKNVIMMSGYDANSLSSIQSNGFKDLPDLTPWNHLSHLLSAERYSWFW